MPPDMTWQQESQMKCQQEEFRAFSFQDDPDSKSLC